jgi:hypothetical protein
MTNNNAIIRQSYIDVAPPSYSSSHKRLLSYKFAKMLNKKYEIGGNNLFIGICDGQVPATLYPKTDGFYFFTAENSASWEKVWNTLGIKAPGKLPLGARAAFLFEKYYDPAYHTAVTVDRINRSFGPLGSTVTVGWCTDLEKNVSAGPSCTGFAVVIVPKTVGGTDFSVSMNCYPSTMVSDYLAKNGTQPSAKKQPPQP